MDQLPLVSVDIECRIEDNIVWALFTFTYVLLFIVFILYLFLEVKEKVNRKIAAESVLLFTAHPDDEVMFFGPTIIKMIRYGIKVHLICFSEGNYDEEGSRRIEELFYSTKELGIQSDRVLITQDDRLKDGPKEMWPIDHLSDLMLSYIEIYEPDAIITFDSSGVSSHLNHIAIFQALKYLVTSRSLPSNTSVYSLRTVNLFRKYISFFDMTFALFTPGFIYTLNPMEYLILIKAMSRHASQFIWFRKLYVAFSRYMYINNYRKIT